MIRMLIALPLVLITGAMVAGCADDSGGKRPVPGYDQSGQKSRFDEPPPNSQRDPYSRSGPGYY
ncbi:MAG: hypothetical protein QM706_13555 [Nitrospira sp.]